MKTPSGISIEAAVEPSALKDCAEELTNAHKLPTLVEVRQSGPGRGRGLFARSDLEAGQLLIDEKSFCWEIEEEGKAVEVRVLPGTDEAKLDAQLLQMAPYECEAGKDATFSSAVPSRQEATKATMAANSFGIRDVCAGGEGSGQGDEGFGLGDYEGRALFSVICLTNHSCYPNCRVTQVPSSGLSPSNPPRYKMETRRAIKAGEELSISYLPRSWRLAKRSKEITGTWGFVCTCERCTAGYDDTVAFRCPNPSCTDESSITGGQQCSLIYLGQEKCKQCGARPSNLSKAAAAASSSSAVPAAAAGAGKASSDGEDGEGYDEMEAASAVDPDDDEAVNAFLMSPLKKEGDVLRTAQRILNCPAPLRLAVEDSRVFSCANELASLLPVFAEQLGGEESAEGAKMVELFGNVSQAIALASMRTAFVSALDLGIEIEVETE